MTKTGDPQLAEFVSHIQAKVGYSRSSILAGMTSSKGLIGYQLQKAVSVFADIYDSKDHDTAELKRSAEEIEGFIMAEQTITAISPSEAETLIDELYNLVEKR